MANEDLLPDLVDADISNISPRGAVTQALIDRSAFADQMTPDMRARLQTIVQGEVGHGATPEQQQIQLETAFNRAAARGQPLEQVTRQYTGPGSSGYYPASTFSGGRIRNQDEYDRFQRDVVEPVLAGSDVGTQRLGFAPTGNASGGVAQRGIASGRYNQAGVVGGETYVQQERTDQLARLQALRRAGGGSINIPTAAPTLTANDLSQDPAFAPTVPLVQMAQANTGTVTDAGNPPIPSEIPKAPEQPPGPQPASGPGSYAPRPSAEPIPQFDYVEPKDPGPEPVQPKALPLSDAQNKAALYKDNPDVSEGTRAHYKHIYDVEESYRKELETRATAAYQNKLTVWNKDKEEFDKRTVSRSSDIIKGQSDRTALEKLQADIDKERYEATQRAAAEAKAAADLRIAQQQGAAGVTKTINGAEYRIGPDGSMAPVTGSPPPQLSETQQKAVDFATRVTPDLDYVDKQLGYGKVLTEPFEILRSYGGRGMSSQEYHSAEDKLGNFAAAFLTMVSGQNVTPSEALRNAPLIIPRFGDTPQDLEDKAERRRRIVEGMRGAAGPQAQRVINEVLTDFQRNMAGTQAQAPTAPSPAPSASAGPAEAPRLPAGTTPANLKDVAKRMGLAPGTTVRLPDRDATITVPP